MTHVSNAADYIVAWLAGVGIRHVFGVSGGRILPLINACAYNQSVSFIHTKHEGGAAFMADGCTRFGLTPIGVCASTSGPGATNLLTGVAGAYADSVPLLVITGQAETGEIGRGGIQEGSGLHRSPGVHALFSPITKASITVNNPNQLPELLGDMLKLATTGRKGPVHVDIPFDVLGASFDLSAPAVLANQTHVFTAVDYSSAIESIVGLFKGCHFPLLLIGQGMRTLPANLLKALADRGIAICTTLGGKGLLDETHPSSLGMIGCYGQEVSADFLINRADAILLIGTSLQYLSTIGWHERFTTADVIHVDIDQGELGKSPSKAGKFVADGRIILSSLAKRFHEEDLQWPSVEPVILQLKAYHGFYPSNQNLSKSVTGSIAPSEVFIAVSKALDNETPVVIDSGENAYWAMLCLKSRSAKFFANCFWGAMGYALPAAIGIALTTKKPVLAFVGDGGFLMTGTELHTAAVHRLPIILFVMDNESYGTQYHWQRDHSATGVYATSIHDFNIGQFAESLGSRYLKLNTGAEIENLILSFTETDGPVVVQLAISKDLKPSQVTYSRLKK